MHQTSLPRSLFPTMHSARTVCSAGEENRDVYNVLFQQKQKHLTKSKCTSGQGHGD